MIKVLSEIVCRENNINGFYKANIRWAQRNLKSLKFFSSGNVHFQENHSNDSNKNDKQLPALICIQNPITWLLNKIDFKMLKTAWDPEFDEEDFKRGSKQAVAVICTLISKNLWDNLRGLVTRQTLSSLRREVEVNWSDVQRRNIDLEPIDIKAAIPRKVHFLRIAEQKFVDIDMLYVAMKYKEEPSPDLVIIKMIARFHRNYTAGELPNWTVSLFKVTRFSMKSGRQFS